MKILSLGAENIRGLKDGRYSFAASEQAEQPADVILVSGAGPCGKTSLLEAVALAKEAAGPYGEPAAPSQVLRRGAASGRIEARWLLSGAELAALAQLRQAGRDERGLPLDQDEDEGGEDPAAPGPVLTTQAAFAEPRGDVLTRTPRRAVDPAVQLLFSRFSRAATVSKVEYFPAHRQMLPQLWRDMPPAVREPYEASLRLSADVAKYGFVRKLFRSLLLDEGLRLQRQLAAKGMLLAADSQDVFGPYRDAVAALTDSLRLTSVEPRDEDEPEVLFTRSDGMVVELGDLAASEQQAVLFGATFIRYGLAGSVVLIDTPELHLHPSQQRRFFQGLLSLGRDNQIIAATSSPAILSGLDGAHIIDLSRQ